VTDDLSIKRLADYVEHELGKLDILVNNAGINIDENMQIPQYGWPPHPIYHLANSSGKKRN
ncbi:MAG: SDR family NAD(P)-dependent oxidoreductase, partial [Archaeoglobaceae archaeon]